MTTDRRPILEVKDLKKYYTVRKLFQKPRFVRAVDGISFSVSERETIAIVGESGCGKSTIAKVLMRIEEPTSGEILIDGTPIGGHDGLKLRQTLQMIFQDPYGSLNPRKKVRTIVGEPLRINTDLSRADCDKRAVEALLEVGLRPETQSRYPHMFSGGQRQRIGIARALVLKPKVIICDEPVSALDVSIQAQVLNQLIELQDRLGLSYIFISHDLSIVRHIADKVLVIYLGRVVECGTRDQIFSDPRHPYTQALLAATPTVSGALRYEGATDERRVLKGELPSAFNPPSGCAFHKRCPVAVARCSVDTPALRVVAGREVSCHLA